MAASTSVPVTTVRYHRAEDGSFWAEAGNWSGLAPTLSDLRKVAHEGIEFMHERPFRSRAYFEITSSTWSVDPVGYEEFWPVELEEK